MDHGVIFETIKSAKHDVVTVSQVKRCESDPRPERFPHLHAWHELVIFEGVEGKLATEAGDYDLSGQCAVWIPRMLVHDFMIEQGDCSWTLIQYDFHKCDTPEDDHILASCMGADDMDRLKNLALWIKTSTSAGHIDETRALLEVIKFVIARSEPLKSEMRTDDLYFNKLKPALTHLHSGNGFRLSLADAASRCSLSSSYFSRLFRQHIGMSYSAYSVQVRLKRAAISLLSSRKPLKQISHENGFHQPAYFSAQFKKQYGVTPSMFRENALH